MTGLNGTGIFAELDQSGSVNGGNGTDTIIDVSGVTGGSNGIFVDHDGSGELSITANGPIVANAGDGMRADNEKGTDTTIIVDDVTATATGIGVTHSGTGAVVVQSTGVVNANGNGIAVANTGNGGTTVTASDVRGGIDAENSGTGITRVTVDGVISSSFSNAAIEADSGAGQQVFVTLQDGAVVENSEAEFAIQNNESDATVTLKAGSRVESAILLNDGSDTLVLDGGEIDTSGVIDGGDDTSVADGFVDTILVTGADVAIDGNQFINFEALTIDGGALRFTNDAFALGAPAEGTGTRIINAGQLSLGSNFLLTGDVNIGFGSNFSAVEGGARIVGRRFVPLTVLLSHYRRLLLVYLQFQLNQN